MPRLHSASDAYLEASNSFGYSVTSRARTIIQDKISLFNELTQQSLDWYQRQSRVKQILINISTVIGFITAILVLVFHKYIIHLLVFLSDEWLGLKFGRLILFILVFLVGFPPLIGFSALSMLAGMVYGFPYGWPLLASASISGSLCSFIVFRYLLQNRAQKLIHNNEKFRAFAEILREDSSLFLLALIRLCPLPYSLSNGALAAIPELPPLTYFLASLITSPKLMIHIFVGSKLKELGDETKAQSTKIIDVIGIIITGLAASLTTYIIYNKMQQKLQSYHQNQNIQRGGYDRLIFGNFEDDLETGDNVELSSADYDADNFIIEDEEDELLDQSSETSKNNNDKSSAVPKSVELSNNEPSLNENIDDLEEIVNSSNNRDY